MIATCNSRQCAQHGGEEHGKASRRFPLKSLALGLAILALVCAAVAQTNNADVGDSTTVFQIIGGGPVPICPDGSVKFLFSTSIGAIFVPSTGANPETAVLVGLCCGALYPCEMNEWLPPKGQPGHIFKFQSGPLLDGDYQSGVTIFSHGGSVTWFSTSESYLGCSQTIPCKYKGVWDSLELTKHTLPDGSIVYTWWGSSEGDYTDELNPKPLHNVRATYVCQTLDYNTPLGQAGQGNGACGLTIATGGVL
jgi:hypothetical protein